MGWGRVAETELMPRLGGDYTELRGQMDWLDWVEGGRCPGQEAK